MKQETNSEELSSKLNKMINNCLSKDFAEIERTQMEEETDSEELVRKLKIMLKSFKLNLSKDKESYLNILFSIYTSKKYKTYMYMYYNDNQTWYIVDNKIYKIVCGYYENDCFYHYYFNKITGYTIRFGKCYDDDPEMCQLGPEILDIEISVNGCPKVGGHNCKFCYKNNTDLPPTNMTLDQFKTIINKFPKNLSQIALGITGVQTNPDFVNILKYCREISIVPNYTLSGADLTDEIAKATVDLCGACAVSCYEGNKQLCYDTIKRLHDLNEDFPVNMHIVLSKGTMNHLWDVLHDIKDGKVVGLDNIVMLHIKPKGRGKMFDCHVPKSDLKKIVMYCMDNNIGFGFDSCTAPGVIDLLKEIGKSEFVSVCEPCESSKFSSYVNVKGEYWHCSFCEDLPQYKPIDILNLNVPFCKMWNHDERILNMRYPKNPVCRSCQAYDIEFTED